LDLVQKLTGRGFSELDGLICDQSTSDTKVQWPGLLHKRKTALSQMPVFTAPHRKTTKACMGKPLAMSVKSYAAGSCGNKAKRLFLFPEQLYP
jgi:hypothetical protein